jgi:hypothetical protein
MLFGVELVNLIPKISGYTLNFTFIFDFNYQVMSAKATRSEKILDRIGARLGLSDAGKQWLIAALDPFHDNPLDCIGYPDGSTSPCVTRVQKYTQTLTAPPGLSTSANWDLMILDTPHPQLVKLFVAQMAGTSTGQPLNIIVLNNAVSNPFGGLWCVTAPAGSNFDFSSVEIGLAANTYGLFPLTIDPTITSGDFRIIAKGFEVHNVTAELYKGGTVTVFQTPLDSYDTAQAFMVTNSGGGGSTTSVLVNPQWPQNSTVAYSLVNSKQWEARDGCYVPGRQLETEIPVENGLNFTDPFYYEGEALTTPILGTSQAAYADLAGTQDGIPATLWENFNFTGAFFTGLTYQSALTVNYLVIVENHPSSQDNIYSLAKPPPCRDDIALSMYSCIVREMPVGVPVAENGLGDWFADAVSTVSDYISPVLSAIPHPGTMALGAGLRAAGNVAKAYNTNPNANPNVGMSVPSGGGASSKAATKLRNAEIRARNEELRLRKAAKAAKKK